MRDNKTMILITSSWEDKKTFKMIPVNDRCLYNECIFDPVECILAIVSKEYKKNLHMIPQLTTDGQVKVGKERIKLDTYYEYFIEEKEEIVDFIKSMADNDFTYNYKDILESAFKNKTVEVV